MPIRHTVTTANCETVAVKMLTEANVTHFLENILQFENWNSVLRTNKRNFLFEIVSKFGTSTQYENITWGATEPHELKLPRIPDIISHVMQTCGGACVHLNYFLKLILEFFKFHVEICSSEVPTVQLPNNHLVLVVKLKSVDELTASDKDDAFLIDVGMGRPITSPIDLNNLPHRGRAGGFDFEVRFNEERQLYERILYRGCAIKGKFESDNMVEVAYDLLNPKQLTDFDETFTIIFTDPTWYFFLNTIFLFKFVRINTENDFEFVSVRGRKLVRGSRDERTEIYFETYSEMADVIVKWFPKVNASVLRKALLNYDSKIVGEIDAKSS